MLTSNSLEFSVTFFKAGNVFFRLRKSVYIEKQKTKYN